MIAVARWPMIVFDLPARNEENSGDPYIFQILLGKLYGVLFERSCIRVEMSYKIIGTKTLTRMFLL